MRRRIKVAIPFIFLLIIGFASNIIWAQETTDEPDAAPTTYTVQAGDNLYRIAIRFGTTTQALATANGITNPSNIFVGQVLTIPGTEATTQPPAGTVTPQATQTTAIPETYRVQVGDTLGRIATRFNTTIAELVALNNIADSSVIFVGQVLQIPGGIPEETVSETPLSDATLEAQVVPTVNAAFGYGIEAYFFGQDPNILVQQIEQLGMDWAKVRVEWRVLEPNQGEIDFTELDTIINTLDARDIQILVNITNAPSWGRSSRDENGPPDDLATFTTFITSITERYQGSIDAYEIWDEPNLRRNWNCERQLCDTDYLEMLELAYNAIKAVDPEAQVITAGLAPTRFNDRVNAINDLVYLETLYANGVTEISDGIGAHPGGWANPPDATCCEKPVGVETHFEDASFYFRENLNAYHQIMVDNGDNQTPLWVTKFGWGTSEDTDPPGEINIFVTYTSLSEQAIYVPRAFELGQELGYVGPMFLDNLNGCQGMPSRAEVCYASLVSPNAAPRLVFDAVQQIDKALTIGVSSVEEEVSPIQPVPLEPVDSEPTPEATEETP